MLRRVLEGLKRVLGYWGLAVTGLMVSLLEYGLLLISRILVWFARVRKVCRGIDLVPRVVLNCNWSVYVCRSECREPALALWEVLTFLIYRRDFVDWYR